METVLRRKLTRHGYELSGAGERPSLDLLRQYAKASFERRSAVRTRWSKESRSASREPSDHIAARLTSRQIALAEARGSA
jgi:hypothetical protein